MALLTIADLETAANQTIAAEDEPYYQWYIDAVSAYILEQYPYLNYGEDVEVVADSGSAGLIQIPNLVSITSVERFSRYDDTYTTLNRAEYSFDGIDTIYDLRRFTTYRLTVSYGSSVVPDAVAAIATQLVLAGSGLDPDAIGGLTEISVGNVREKYGVTTNGLGEPVVSMSSLQSGVLKNYRPQNVTWRV